MYSFARLVTLAVLIGVPLASAHGMIVSASGDAGGNGIGLGVSSPTSDNLQDVTQFNGNGFGTVGVGQDSFIVAQGTVGSLILVSQNSGNINDLATLLPAAEEIAGDTLPQVTVGGTVTMAYRQLNTDGAGPVTCQVSADATECFANMEVTTNVPGDNGRSNVENTNFPLVAQMPAGVTCTGTIGNATNACLVQCKNPAGPFGSNVIIQMATDQTNKRRFVVRGATTNRWQ